MGARLTRIAERFLFPWTMSCLARYMPLVHYDGAWCTRIYEMRISCVESPTECSERQCIGSRASSSLSMD